MTWFGWYLLIYWIANFGCGLAYLGMDERQRPRFTTGSLLLTMALMVFNVICLFTVGV